MGIRNNNQLNNHKVLVNQYCLSAKNNGGHAMRNFAAILAFAVVGITCGCAPNKPTGNNRLTAAERRICDSLQIDTAILKALRQHNQHKAEPFSYSLDRDGKGLKPAQLNGLMFDESNSRSYKLIFDLKDGFRQKGYTIFMLDNNFNIEKKPDRIAVVKTTDKYALLTQIGTDGINYNITNDSLINIIRQFDKKYSLELIGASGDWCEFVIHKEPKDWLAFAKEVYKVCPDVVDQGAESVEALAAEMKTTKRLYFWWD